MVMKILNRIEKENSLAQDNQILSLKRVDLLKTKHKKSSCIIS